MTSPAFVAARTVARADSWPVLTEFTAEAAQQVFHDMMEAMSQPGTFRDLGEHAPPSPVPAAVTPILTLADLMTPLAVLESPTVSELEAGAIAATLSGLTGAPIDGPGKARFVLALEEPKDWDELNTGSHWSPELGALLVQRVEAVSPDTSGDLAVRLTGPGIHPGRPTTISVSGLSVDWFVQRAALTSSYPAGIDCILVSDKGSFVCIPRTTRIEIL